MEKKGVEQKQKQDQKQKRIKKQSGLLFFGLDVFFWYGLSFSILVWPLFLFFTSGQAANPDRSQRMLCPGPYWW
jgi:hypothetical protein